ncbi:MAG: DUF4918 family protein [Chitinophagaceae bacterium]|nr:DUF4918 family protein [Chitinophagaceae bacterium]
MKTFADKVIGFNKQLNYKGSLPAGIQIMNPFRESKDVSKLSGEFYRKYYSDEQPRHIILGINPGRFGAGITGVPFTDPKRLVEKCGIPYSGKMAHEPSSVFIYEMIDAFGGPEKFYSLFYINSICPLGFTAAKPGSKTVVNYNYYDNAQLTEAVYPFIVKSVKQQIKLGVYTHACICFGTGKNENFLRKLNDREKLFNEIIALEHPRFIMQYKSKSKDLYIDKYLSAFQRIATFQKNIQSV